MSRILLLAMLVCTFTYLGVGCVPPNLPEPAPESEEQSRALEVERQAREDDQTKEADGVKEAESKGTEEKAPAAKGTATK